VIPIRDENPTHRFPFMTVALIALNVGVFVYELTLGQAGFTAFWNRWAFVPARFLANPFSAEQLMTVFTAMFMHAGWVHVAGNLLYLWIFGNNIEDRLGRGRFVVFYLLCGVAGTLAQAMVSPASMVPNLGASGAIAGVLGAYLVLYPGASVLTLIPIFFFVELARLPAVLVIGFWFVLQLGSGLAALGAGMMESGGVAWFAHIGGFVTGVVLMLPLALQTRRRGSQGRAKTSR